MPSLGEQFWFVVYQYTGPGTGSNGWTFRPDLSDQSARAQDMAISRNDFWSDDPATHVQPAWYWTGCYERLPWEQWHLMADPAPQMGRRET